MFWLLLIGVVAALALAQVFFDIGSPPVGVVLRIAGLALLLIMAWRALMAGLLLMRRNNCPRCDYRLFPGSNICMSCGFVKEDQQES